MLDEIVYSKEVIEFVTVSNEFCSLLENGPEDSRGEFVEKLQKIMPLLYLKALMLPQNENVYNEANEKFVTEGDWHLLSQGLERIFGEYDSFMEIFDEEYDHSDIPVRVSISEMIADVYQDIKDFLMLYRVGTSDVMNDAVWECRQTFETIWGQKLTNAIKALHPVSIKLKHNEEDPDGLSLYDE